MQALVDDCREGVLTEIDAHRLYTRIRNAVQIALESLVFEYGVFVCQEFVTAMKVVIRFALCHQPRPSPLFSIVDYDALGLDDGDPLGVPSLGTAQDTTCTLKSCQAIPSVATGS